MDIQRKIDLVSRLPTEEVLVPEELKTLFETNNKPIAYNGFEPSGMMHLGTGLICSYKMKDFIEAGVKFKIYLAVWHAWINNKLGGDIDLIKKAAEHFRHGWTALGVPEKKVEYIYADELYEDSDFWRKMIHVAKNMTVARAKRTMMIMGRKEEDAGYVSDLIYTPMQVADIFQMDIDIAQLGMDQRKANVVAREVGEKIGYWKPVCVHHHLLQGLVKPSVWPLPEGQEKESLADIKMSKSKPDTAIFIYDSVEDIKKKINNAFCPEKTIQFNPVMDLAKHIVFREVKTFKIERPSKFGGTLEFENFDELAKTYVDGKLHPMDLKNAVASVLVDTLKPVRDYFEKNKDARASLEVVKGARVTR